MSSIQENVTDYVNALLGAYLLRGADGEARALPYNPLDYQVIRYVGMNAGCRATDIAGSLRVVATTLQSALDRLVRKGLLEKAPSPADGRAKLYTLTAEGARIRAEIRAQDVSNMKAILDTLSPEDAKHFAELLGKIAGGLNA